ncbi:MAG TPA: class I SAM-dependent methyltransferase family protein, partial [archaeon]|nr:class I SAM-dependent methyltransferase family protein [archaeon]
EISEELKDRKSVIGKTIMNMSKNISSVLNKASARKGEFRTRDYELVSGDADTEVLHKEHGYSLKIDPRKAYFSAKEGTERQRIARQIERGEVVMIFFAGIGAYAVAIASEQPDVGKIIAIEINSDVAEYMRQNIRINRVADKVRPILGDVRKDAGRFYGECDRVVMPLPLGAAGYLEEAIRCLRGKGVVHFYSVVEQSDFSEAERAVQEACGKIGKRYKILNEHKVTEYSPRKWKVCIDFEVGTS